jgi:hypothetical protein
MRVLRYLTLTLLLIVAACSDSSAPSAVPPTFAVTPASQWAGGTVLVRSPFFDGLDSLPPVTAAGIEMVVTRVDDSTVSATLPSIPTQTAAVEVIDGATRYLVDSVGIVGFRTHWVGSPAASGNPVMVRATGGVFGLAGIVPPPTEGAIGVVALEERRVIVESGVEPVDAAGLRAVGVTFDSSRYILRDSAGMIAEWQLLPGPTLVDTVPSSLQSPYARIIVRLSKGVWLNTHPHSTDVIRPGLPTYSVDIEDPHHFTLSVGADRAILTGGYPLPGAVVFQMSTGDTLYRVPTGWVSGAAFTVDGGTLYVGTTQLVVVRASDGTVLNQAPLPVNVFDVLGLALARNDSRLLVAVQDGSRPSILVYDAGTLTLLGRLESPPDADSSVGGWLDADVIADDETNTAYVMGAGGYVWEFDLLP